MHHSQGIRQLCCHNNNSSRPQHCTLGHSEIRTVKVSVLIQHSGVPHTHSAQAWITQFYLQLHQCLPLPRKRSPDGASADWGCEHLIAAYYSFIRPKEWKAESVYEITYTEAMTAQLALKAVICWTVSVVTVQTTAM